eukprot:GHVL01011023.1.p1 GENE.GHVL01011023.1~~GHVL01011023.1.p1  ORF type:complete len:526 (-),score=68.28 GHVL01011023.1:76-1653(-)
MQMRNRRLAANALNKLHLYRYNGRPLFCYPVNQIARLLLNFSSPILLSNTTEAAVDSAVWKLINSEFLQDIDIVWIPCDSDTNQFETHFAYLSFADNSAAFHATTVLRKAQRAQLECVMNDGTNMIVGVYAGFAEPFFNGGLHYQTFSRAIFVEGLPEKLSSIDLFRLFEHFGEIEWCKTRARSKSSEGWVWFDSFQKAALAQDKMDGQKLQSMCIRVVNAEIDPQLRERTDRFCEKHGDASGNFPSVSGRPGDHVVIASRDSSTERAHMFQRDDRDRHPKEPYYSRRRSREGFDAYTEEARIDKQPIHQPPLLQEAMVQPPDPQILSTLSGLVAAGTNSAALSGQQRLIDPQILTRLSNMVAAGSNTAQSGQQQRLIYGLIQALATTQKIPNNTDIYNDQIRRLDHHPGSSTHNYESEKMRRGHNYRRNDNVPNDRRHRDPIYESPIDNQRMENTREVPNDRRHRDERPIYETPVDNQRIEIPRYPIYETPVDNQRIEIPRYYPNTESADQDNLMKLLKMLGGA